MNSSLVLLSIIVFLPALAALVISFLPKAAEEMIRFATLMVTIAVFVLCVVAFFFGESSFDIAVGDMQYVFNQPWIPSFNIYYFMGMDGISFPLLVLTAFISMLAMAASWSIRKHVKAYCILFLLLETGMLGVFLSLDFFLFYVFWEVMLLPMYFLIGVWGGPRREYAAIKFFLYTLVGSVLMLIAILVLYFNSDLQTIADASDLYGDRQAAVTWSKLQLHPAATAKVSPLMLNPNEPGLSVVHGGVSEALEATYDETAKRLTLKFPEGLSIAAMQTALSSNEVVGNLAKVVPAAEADSAIAVGIPKFSTQAHLHTFNILAMMAQGQHTDAFTPTIQWWCFVLLFIGFAIKVPAVPVHTWLPDAHVEAPTPISMILAGVLLKMGGYGIIRMCYPICPYGGLALAYWVCSLGVLSMIYGAFAALAQKDFKRMVAYSSVSHMGYVVLGLGVWSATSAHGFDPQYWNQGVQGAMFQMIAHGISSAGMFFMVGIIYDRVHHRQLDQFGGLFGKMPAYTALAIGLFFAGLGLPGLCGFIGEVMVVLSVWRFDWVMAVLSASVVILTASYILWAVQRVYLGAEYKGPHEEDITPITTREFSIGAILLSFAILFGVAPNLIFRYMDATISQQTNELADWTRNGGEAMVDREQAGLASGPATSDGENVAVDATPMESIRVVAAPQRAGD